MAILDALQQHQHVALHVANRQQDAIVVDDLLEVSLHKLEDEVQIVPQLKYIERLQRSNNVRQKGLSNVSYARRVFRRIITSLRVYKTTPQTKKLRAFSCLAQSY